MLFYQRPSATRSMVAAGKTKSSKDFALVVVVDEENRAAFFRHGSAGTRESVLGPSRSTNFNDSSSSLYNPTVYLICAAPFRILVTRHSVALRRVCKGLGFGARIFFRASLISFVHNYGGNYYHLSSLVAIAASALSLSLFHLYLYHRQLRLLIT